MLYLEVMRTLITVIFVIVKVRRGSDEEHREWDARQELRYRLKDAAEEVLGENYGMESVTDKRKFFYTLLCDNAVIDALRGGKKEKLSSIIKHKRKTYLGTTEKSQVRFFISLG